MSTQSPPAIITAATLMRDYLARTGLDAKSPRRYLWTDAFAVCNLLGLAVTDPAQRQAALALIDQVHHTLGQHRADNTRLGWLGAADEAHPTRGGLRIGKPEPERAHDEPFDERREWDRDGQYFHYLTKWMHALDQTARFTNDPRFNRWARELADTACRAFIYRPSAHATPRMYWKMSTDLSRPLVASMGQHDPLDGYITCIQLQSTASIFEPHPGEPDLDEAIEQLSQMLEDGRWASTDPLGIGGLLSDAGRVAQLIQQGSNVKAQLLEQLLDAAGAGLHYYRNSDELRLPAEYRLAFRELGLAIGFNAIDSIARGTVDTAVRDRLRALQAHRTLGDDIVRFWRNPAHQQVASWIEHRDINEVMLATALDPDGFLLLSPPTD
jgi:hypothetical protein